VTYPRRRDPWPPPQWQQSDQWQQQQPPQWQQPPPWQQPSQWQPQNEWQQPSRWQPNDRQPPPPRRPPPRRRTPIGLVVVIVLMVGVGIVGAGAAIRSYMNAGKQDQQSSAPGTGTTPTGSDQLGGGTSASAPAGTNPSAPPGGGPGPAGTIAMPDLLGKNAGSAREDLRTLGFTQIQLMGEDASPVTDPVMWVVMKQSARAGDKVGANTAIVLTCRRGY
jgi:hypothetical protein